MANVHAALSDARTRPCILCGKAPAAAGIWTPTPSVSRRLGAPAGKLRCIAYSVCRSHARRKFVTAVEDKIMADVAADLAAAQADLAALTGKADNLRRAKDASTPGGPKALGALGDLLDPAGLDSALGAAKAKIDVAGSFSAGAFRGLGVGESVAGDQLKEQQKTTKELTTLNRKIDRAKWVLTD